MAKIKGPLMSLSASGTIADTFTFRTQRGAAVVHKKLTPRKTNSTEQAARQAIYAGICIAWRALDSAAKTGWELIGKSAGVTGFNAYMSSELIAAYNGGPTPPPTTYTTWDETNMGASLTLDSSKLVATFAGTGGSGYSVRTTKAIPTGKRLQWELSQSGDTWMYMYGGMINDTVDLTAGNYYLNQGAASICVRSYLGGFRGSDAATCTAPIVGDIITFGLDTTTRTLDVWINGTIAGESTVLPAGDLYAAVSIPDFGGGNCSCAANFGPTQTYPQLGYTQGIEM